jgi:hypothetical protein
MPLIGGSDATMNREGPWPSCVGMSGEACQAMIESMANDVTVQVVSQDAMVTMDFRTDRVRIFVDDSGVVTRTPSRG